MGLLSFGIHVLHAEFHFVPLSMLLLFYIASRFDFKPYHNANVYSRYNGVVSLFY